MFCLTWVPSPSSKRPPDIFCRSQEATATVMGLRGKATSTAVPTISLSVAWSARAASRSPSWMASGTCSPSKPMASALAAWAPISPGPMFSGVEAKTWNMT